MGVSAAVGSATAAALTGTAWAGSPVGAVPAQRSPAAALSGAPATAHRCGHGDTIAVTRGTPVDAGTADAVVVRAVDGAGDPVEAAFGGTTLRVTVPRQRPATAVRGGSSAGASSAEVRTVLPVAGRPRTYAVRAVATFDDGITECRWSTQVVVPPSS
jgi:hypothetical protein